MSEPARIRRPTAERFIRKNLRIVHAPALPEIRLYAAHPGSGLNRLIDPEGTGDAPPPYWAYHWAGGTVLARHILDHPQTVAGRRVLDLGAGSGVVGIAAALAGALSVVAADIDRHAMAAISLNADLNHVTLVRTIGDVTAGPPLPVDLVLVGDLFYEETLAQRVTAFLERCVAAGVPVLIGDPGRAPLPRASLTPLAEYPVPDFGEAGSAAVKHSAVFAFGPDASGRPPC